MSTNTTRVNNPMKVITGPDTRWSYANVWEPKSINGGTPKYSVSLIIPKSDTKTIAKIKAAIEAAYQEGQAKLKGNGKSVPSLAAIKTPLRDGDIERPDDPAYANSYFINANSATAPGIVDADRNPVLTRSEVYSGVYGRASINLYAFTTGKPIPSPFINIGINYMNQAVRLWNEIFQIVKENCSTEYGESTPQDDLMERLLRARKG